MNAIAAIAVSGMQAARLRLDVAAHNIANVATDGFSRQTVESSARADGGVDVAVRTAADGGDLLDDIVALKLASYQFRANALSLQHAGDLLGVLLDRRA